MKIVYSFIPALLIMLLTSFCNSKKHLKNASSQTQLGYKILEIDSSTQSIYLIYAERNDSVIKIVSTYEGSVTLCNPIKLGERYDFKVESALGNRVQKNEVSIFRFKGKEIKLGDRGTVWDLFYSENLNGLCFVSK